MDREVLKDKGYKITKNRDLVFAYFKKNKKKLSSAKEIYSQLKGQMDRVTVYRILEVLEQAGMVFKEQIGKESFYYLADKRHHHIICKKCGYIECVACSHIFDKFKNFNNISHQLILTGLCNKCNK
jgi:Fur family ferric uptake transcriptional regulator